MRTYGDIDWEDVEIVDRDVDGHGTNAVVLTGYAACAEGGGHFEITANAQHPYPYEEFEDVEIEEAVFIPREREPEDGK